MSAQGKHRSILWPLIACGIAVTAFIANAVVDFRDHAQRKREFETQRQLIQKMVSDQKIKKWKTIPPRPKVKRHTR